MDYNASDSSGTDDDLPPSHRNKVVRGSRISGNGRSAVVRTHPYPRTHDIEMQIHRLEQEAYSSVLRAFKAQSNAITWEKESLITELRKELRVSSEEHRELLIKVNSDDIIQTIRELRQSSGNQAYFLNTAQPVRSSVPSPTISASCKQQKTSKSMPKSVGASSPVLRQQVTMHPTSSVVKRGTAAGVNGKKRKPICQDIRWKDEDPGISCRTGHGGPGSAIKKSMGPGGTIPGLDRGGRVTPKNQAEDFAPSQNGIGRKISGDIKILNTDTLIKQVEMVFGAGHPDPLEIEKAEKMLKEHEQALIDAITKLADESDGISEEGEHPSFHGQSEKRDQRQRQYGSENQHAAEYKDDTIAGVEASDSDQKARQRRVTPDDQQDGDDSDEGI